MHFSPLSARAARRVACRAARAEMIAALRALGWPPGHLRDAERLPDLRGAGSVRPWRDLVGSVSWAIEDRDGVLRLHLATRDMSAALDALFDVLVATRWP